MLCKSLIFRGSASIFSRCYSGTLAWGKKQNCRLMLPTSANPPLLNPALGSNLFNLGTRETRAHDFGFRLTVGVEPLTLKMGKQSRWDTEELAGGSSRWWHSVWRSHGDIHHRHVAHNVITKSLCTLGLSYIKECSPIPLNMKTFF